MTVLTIKGSRILTFLLTTTCYEKIPSKQGSEKNAVVGMANMVSKGSTDYQWELRFLRENWLA